MKRCPAMRNTHDYADSVWTPFKESGCNWSNASSFIRVDENKGYMTDFKKEADVLFLGDSQLDTAYWRTYASDVGKKGIMNMASSGTKISDWRGRAQALAEYNPKKIVLYAGMDEVNGSAAGQSAEKIAEEIGLTADSLGDAGCEAVRRDAGGRVRRLERGKNRADQRARQADGRLEGLGRP